MITDLLREKVFKYLSNLRKSGEINMMGATGYIMIEFNIPESEARLMGS